LQVALQYVALIAELAADHAENRECCPLIVFQKILCNRALSIRTVFAALWRLASLAPPSVNHRLACHTSDAPTSPAHITHHTAPRCLVDGRSVGTADDLHHAIGEIAPPTLEDLSAYTARAAATGNKALNLQSFPVNRGKAPLRPLIESWRYGADLAPDLEGACVIL
jgi:hypothetical protein